MSYTGYAIAIAASYLLGSVPFGVLLARAHGKDLRSIGSGNIGATNVARALGRKWAYLCFVLDLLKGLVPTLATGLLAPAAGSSETERIIGLWLWLAVGSAAVLGHIFPIYLRFRGGKGVATSFGVALGIWPYYTVCATVAVALWVAVALSSRYVSLASIVASAVFPVTLGVAVSWVEKWRFRDLWPLLIVATAIPLMVTIRHRQNIKRLIEGTESKIGRSRRKTD